MGYEGYVVGDPDDTARRADCAASMEVLRRAHEDVGGPVVSAGGTGTEVWFCSDEHVTFAPTDAGGPWAPGDRVLGEPAHVDPTVAYHETLHVADGPGLDSHLVDSWPVDLRGW